MAAQPTVSPHDTPPLWLACLGRAELRRTLDDAAETPILGAGKPIAVLAYLQFAPGRTASREHLTDFFWADLDPTAARHALRQLIWYLRRLLGTDVFTTHNGDVTLAAPLRSDREEFEAAVAALDFERAVGCYAGEFLPGLAVPGALQFEQWADSERTRLRMLFMQAGDRLVHGLLGHGRMRDAREIAKRVRDADPLSEMGWRLLIEALLSAGDQVTALAEAERLERTLRAEGRTPERTTATMIARARRVPEPQVGEPARTFATELVGREREFAAIQSAWDSVRNGKSRRVHVLSAAGVGKTRLLEEFAARLGALGARVAHTRANPGERDIPYAAAADVAAGLCALPGAAGVAPESAAALVSLNPALSSLFPAARREDAVATQETLRRRALALADLIAAVTEDAPVALLLDDLHWMDEASLQTLTGSLARSGKARLLCVTTSRPHFEATGVEGDTIDLSPLTPRHIGELVAGLGRLPDDPWSDRLSDLLHAATGGSPLLVIETLLLALDRGWLERTESGWHCPDPSRLATELTAGSALRQRVESLDRRRGWLLHILASAGAPVEEAIICRATGQAAEQVAQDLHGLEKAGFAARSGAGWIVAHDAIAETALDGASDSARRAAHLELGRALAVESGERRDVLRRAARHLALAEASDDLASVFGRWARLAWRSGESRSPRALVEDLLGRATPPALQRSLVKTVPLHRRLGLTSRLRVATAAVGLVLVGAAAFTALRPRTPDAWLIAYVSTASDRVAPVQIPVRPQSGDPTAPIDLSRGRPLPWSGFRLYDRRSDGAWVAAQRVDDGGGDELFLLRPGHPPQRLTESPNDDVAGVWSPDGKRIVFSTGRWDDRAWYDLALYDLALDSVLPLTRTPDSEMTPSWSPDGSTIAFVRQSSLGGPTKLCLIAVDGSDDRCIADAIGVLGWRGPSTLLAELDLTPKALAEVDAVTGAVTILDRGLHFASRDGTWITAHLQRPGMARAGVVLYRIDRMAEARPVEPDTSLRFIPQGPFALPARRPDAYIERLSVSTSAGGAVPLGAPTQFTVAATGPTGRTVDVPYVRWTVSDTTAAAIDGDGVLRPRRAGTVTVYASAGGWRADSLAVTVAPSDGAIVLEEAWSDGWRERWVQFGDPRPEVTEGPDGVRAIWNRGDGSYISGAYTRLSVDGSRGAGLEALVSAPLTDAHWQIESFMISAPSDSTVLAAWDHRSGDSPFIADPRRCAVTFPSAEGRTYADKLGITAGTAAPVTITHPPDMFAAPWFRLRVQLFPDGRCGVAVNGVPAGIAPVSIRAAPRYRIVIGGNSVNTRMLVGPLTVWEGVRTDVKWDQWRAGNLQYPIP